MKIFKRIVLFTDYKVFNFKYKNKKLSKLIRKESRNLFLYMLFKK